MTEDNDRFEVECSTRAPSAIERLIPRPRRREIDHAGLAASPAHVWEAVRHADLARSPGVRALLAIGTLTGRWPSRLEDSRLCVDDFRSTAERPGFQVLEDEPPRRFTVGAIARVQRMRLTFSHVDGPTAFESFAEPGFIKVAWSVNIYPRGADYSHLRFEFRTSATDAAAMRAGRLYFALIAPGIHYMRRRVLGSLADELGWKPPSIQPTASALG
ncbi:MAG TPA: hypothetical protein VNN80_30575 [Polyangiaceae bacterium]|nr:hypothetical protein [Polyangiaceae bacterium]